MNIRRRSSHACNSSSSSSAPCVGSGSAAFPQPNMVPIKLQSELRPTMKRKKKHLPGDGEGSPDSNPNSRRTSIYRGVTKHRWTGRYEAHLWDKTTWNSAQKKRGKQIYLGAYDVEEEAARTYDLAALRYWGTTATLNFPEETYAKEVEEMGKFTREEYLASLRRNSSGFSRGISKYRGVARHHHNGRWEARIGRVCGNKYLYLGTYNTEEEAAAAYDMAAIQFRGANAVTNFDINKYVGKPKKAEDTAVAQVKQRADKPPLSAEELHDHLQKDVQRCHLPELRPVEFIVSEGMADGHDNPWDLCLDIAFDAPSLPDVVVMEEASQFFDYRGFEDDIECIFDEPLGALPDAISGIGDHQLKNLVAADQGDSSSSSPYSSTSICSSNML